MASSALFSVFTRRVPSGSRLGLSAAGLALFASTGCLNLSVDAEPDRSVEQDSGEVESAEQDSGEVESAQQDSGEVESAPCDVDEIGEESGQIVSIYRVENGQLSGVCSGAHEEILDEAWDALAEVSPPEQLDPVVRFAGFEGDGETLAFAGPIDDAFTQFVVAVDLGTAADDPDELRLTMVHELAHVFTQTGDQLDLSTGPDSCQTFFNGAGCFRDGSFMADWVAEFWSQTDVNSLPTDGGADELGGEDRCIIDPTFLGAYSASHPEEDFAESFSAYVFDIDVPEQIDAKFQFFDDRPELTAFRDRAAAADVGAMPNNFDRCGS